MCDFRSDAVWEVADRPATRTPNPPIPPHSLVPPCGMSLFAFCLPHLSHWGPRNPLPPRLIASFTRPLDSGGVLNIGRTFATS